MTDCSLETPVPEWVIDHPETLVMFQQLGIDYCCGGKSLEFACRERGLNQQAVLEIILEIIGGEDQQPGPSSPTC